MLETFTHGKMLTPWGEQLLRSQLSAHSVWNAGRGAGVRGLHCTRHGLSIQDRPVTPVARQNYCLPNGICVLVLVSGLFVVVFVVVVVIG